MSLTYQYNNAIILQILHKKTELHTPLIAELCSPVYLAYSGIFT